MQEDNYQTDQTARYRCATGPEFIDYKLYSAKCEVSYDEKVWIPACLCRKRLTPK